MRSFILTLMFCLFGITVNAQRIIKHPDYQKNDSPEFYIDSIAVYKDSTLVYYTYENIYGKGSWVNIDKAMSLIDNENRIKYPILSSIGIPIGPQRKVLDSQEHVFCVLKFPGINTSSISIIEHNDTVSFNIYNIDLTHDGSYVNVNLTKDCDESPEYKLFYSAKDMWNSNRSKSIEIYTKLLDAAHDSTTNPCLQKLEGDILTVFSDSAQYIPELISTMESILGKENSVYLYCLRGCVHILYNNGKLLEAVNMQNKAIEAWECAYGSHNDTYYAMLCNLLTLNSLIGQVDVADEICDSLELRITGDVENIEPNTIAGICNAISSYSTKSKDHRLNLLLKAINIYRKAGIVNKDYVTMLNNLSLDYYENGEQSLALAVNDSAMNLCQKKYPHDLDVYPYVFRNRGIIMSNNLQESINCYKRSLEIFERTNNLPEMIDLSESIIHNYAKFIFEKYGEFAKYQPIYNNEDSVYRYYYKAFSKFCPLDSMNYYYNMHNKLCQIIKSKFKYLSENEKRSYRDKICRFYDDNGLFMSAYFGNDTESKQGRFIKYKNINILGSVYDGLLISNGFLLNDYSKYNSGQESITWRSIQESMKDDEISVWFIPCKCIDDTICYAYFVDKELSAPYLVPICKYEELTKAYNENDYNQLYNLVWKDIEGMFENRNKIYMATSGIFSKIPLEYAFTLDHQCISDKYNIYRLSSLREITSDKPSHLDKIALLGDMNYNYEISSEISEVIDDSSTERGLSKDIMSRSGFESLPNTSKEIDEISHICNNLNVSCSVFKGKQCTEQSICKELQTNSYSIIHFATHGLFIGGQESLYIKEKNNFQFIKTKKEGDKTSYREDPLSRSFLVLTGGNMLCRRKKVLSFDNDGILTASEISHMNLSNTSLVVLSACQTGLGDITNEGVMGLQYGLKRSGVQSILMSLGNVDDKATQLLMVEFYRNLLSGKTKHDSLLTAQRYLRTIENGKYKDPKYWASFILLDALN